MPSYISGQRLRIAVERLRESRASGGMINFLILKRTIALDPEKTVKLSKNDPHFQQAIDELAWWPEDAVAENTVRPFVDVFGSLNAPNDGMHFHKWRSNGPADTVRNGAWNGIVEIRTVRGQRSKVAVLRDKYLEDLQAQVLLRDVQRVMPRIEDAAIWYFRRRAVEPIIGKTRNAAMIESLLAQSFAKDLQLTDEDRAILFGSGDTDNG